MTSELWAIGTAILFLATALLAVWLAMRILKIENTGVLVVLLLIPAVTYLIVSGRLGEFKAPGGLEAKFVLAASQPVRVTTTVEPLLQPVQLTERGSREQLSNKLARISGSKPVVLTVKLGKSYDREDWLTYVNALLDKTPVVFAVLVDSQDRFIAYMTASSIREQLQNVALGGELIRLIAGGAVEKIVKFPGVETEVPSTEDSAIDALRIMKKQELNSLIVINQDQRIVGIVGLEDIISQIILDLAEVSGNAHQVRSP